jgi:HD-GYP domain-containing protein (c-di-GMP phosphodiesterase class II)
LGRQGRWRRALRSRLGRRKRTEQARKALEILSRVMDLSDPYTSEHSRDIAQLVRRVGARFGIEGEARQELELAARFHDIGKVAVPEDVLRKPGPLDSHEWYLMACHVEWGSELLRHLPECQTIARIVRHHHERYDGGGYPDGLKGRQIPLASRIITVCDAYGAMMSNRPYRRALEPERAIEELRAGAGRQFDPEAVAALLSVAEADEVDAELVSG